MRLLLSAYFVVVTAAHARAEVFAWECNSFPVAAGWQLIQQFCEPITWLEDGWYHQELNDDACPDEPEGALDAYTQTLDTHLDSAAFYVEWRLVTDGLSSEFIGGGPSALAIGNSFGIRYTFFVARDLAKLNRDNLLPIVFVALEPGIPHTHRLELHGGDSYAWYIDGKILDSGEPEGPFPSNDPSITFVGDSWQLPNLTRWDYIRFGDVPDDTSGDFDSDGAVDGEDFYFFHECAANSGPGVDAGPGCRWADMDGDTDVDLIDFGLWQIAFTGG